MPRACAAASASAVCNAIDKRAFERQRATVDELPHVSALDVLHRDEVDAVDLVEIEDGADVWVVERGSEARFALKTFEIGFFRGELGGQNFDDKRAAELGIDGFIDRALTALTELLENLVIAQRRTDH